LLKVVFQILIYKKISDRNLRRVLKRKNSGRLELRNTQSGIPPPKRERETQHLPKHTVQ